MASREHELQDLKEKNNVLSEEVQYWKVLAGRREKEIINLIKELNELRSQPLQLSMLRSDGTTNQARKLNLEAAMQLGTKKALNHLMHASSEIKRTIDITKAFKEEQATYYVPHISSLGGTPVSAKKKRVHKVPPMIGGQSIQPVVALTMLDTSNLYNEIIDVEDSIMFEEELDLTRVSNEVEEGSIPDSDEVTLQRRVSNEVEEGSIPDSDEVTLQRRVSNEVEEGSIPDSDEVTLQRREDNPLEGPSWMLDAVEQIRANAARCNLPLDSPTELNGQQPPPPPARHQGVSGRLLTRERHVSRERTPTVKPRVRTVSSPPDFMPRHTGRYSPPFGSPLYSPHPARRARNIDLFKWIDNSRQRSRQRETDTERQRESRARGGKRKGGSSAKGDCEGHQDTRKMR